MGRANYESLPYEEQQLFIMNADARDLRRQSILGRLLVPQLPIRGKQRSWETYGQIESKPEIIPSKAVSQLNKILKNEQPLMDEITGQYRINPNPDEISNYIMAANRNNKTVGRTTEEKEAVRLSKQRQSQHVADLVFRNFRLSYQTARLYDAAVVHVQDANKFKRPYNPTAALWAAGAIEDFGYCLSKRLDITNRMSPTYSDIAQNLQNIGAYAANEPTILSDQDEVLGVVELEMSKRMNYWRPRISAFKAMPGEFNRDRRNSDEQEVDTDIRALIADFAIIGDSE